MSGPYVDADDRLIRDAEWDEEFGHLDPIAEVDLERVQDDYERTLGWGCD